MSSEHRNSIYFYNGKYLSREKIKLSCSDLGFIRGFGLYEALRTYCGVPFLLEDHLTRFFKGVKKVGMKSPLDQRAISKVIENLIRKNGLENALIRMVLTGGPASSLLADGKPTFLIMVSLFQPYASWKYKKGVALMTTPFARIYPEIKSTVYFGAVVATMKAVHHGFSEAVYIDENGALIEGTTFNVFAVLPGPRLVTPYEGALAGITRGCTLQLAKKLKIPIQYGLISREVLHKAKELFITSSTRELMPVVRVDRHQIGKGQPGEVTYQLSVAYRAVVKAYTLKNQA